MSANGKSIVSIDNPIYSEENEMDSTLDKEKLTCLRRGHVAKWSVLTQKIIVEQIKKESGELPEFVMNSKTDMKLGQLLEISL